MSTILSAPISEGSVRRPIQRMRTDLMEDGTARGTIATRELHYELRVLWENRPRADVDTVEAFFDANKTTTFTYTWPLGLYDLSDQYRVSFRRDPVFQTVPGDNWNIELLLVGRKI